MDTVSIQVDILPSSVPSDDVVSCQKFVAECCLEIDIDLKELFYPFMLSNRSKCNLNYPQINKIVSRNSSDLALNFLIYFTKLISAIYKETEI